MSVNYFSMITNFMDITNFIHKEEAIELSYKTKNKFHYLFSLQSVLLNIGE